MTTSGSRAWSPLGSEVSDSLPDLSGRALKPGRARPPQSGERGAGAREAEGARAAPPSPLARWALVAFEKEPQLRPACADPLLSKALSDGFTSLPAFVERCKNFQPPQSKHFKAPSFQNPSHFQKSLEFHLSIPTRLSPPPPPHPHPIFCCPWTRVFFINFEAVQVKLVFSSRVLRAGSSFVI